MRYIQQLDSLRAIAILLVLCNHATPPTSMLYTATSLVAGPDIFFTISGFLITALLLKDRNALAEHRISKAAVFKNFFIKRVVRIFPAYYLAVATDYAVQSGKHTMYHPYWTFTVDFAVYQQQQWCRLAQLWTMSVEQQFYLVWPFIILLMPRRLLPFVLVFFIGVGLYSQWVLPPTEFQFVLPQTCCDALGLGALLAWVLLCRPQVFSHVYRGLGVLAVGSAGVILSGTAVPFLNHRALVALVVVWLIAYFYSQKPHTPGGMGWLFTNKHLILIGKMSYGIFPYHLTVMYEAYPMLAKANKSLPFYDRLANSHALIMAECIGLTLLLAWVSWQYVELPLYKLGKQLLTNVKPRQEAIGRAVLS